MEPTWLIFRHSDNSCAGEGYYENIGEEFYALFTAKRFRTTFRNIDNTLSTKELDPRIASVKEAQEILIAHTKHVCGINILKQYPHHKQFNVINQLGYTEADKKAMISFMMDCREECNKEISRIERITDHNKLIKYVPTKPKGA